MLTRKQTILLRQLKAVASPARLGILHDLKEPSRNFPPQIDGDPDVDGICADFIRERLGVSAPTASRHLGLLVEAGLLRATRKKGWTFYRRNEDALRKFAATLARDL